MIARLRLIVLLTRPAVAVLLLLFVAIGAAAAGAGNRYDLLARGLLAVLGYLLFSVAVNDLADQAIDAVNLPDDRRRPLVNGGANRGDMVVIAVVGGGVAVAVAAWLDMAVAVVVACGLLLSAAYSVPPIRLSGRGALAAMLLPANYVAVPFLVGFLATGSELTARHLLLLSGLYVGFVGRIVLKDFRDVRGDALFGKRTFLVRHGRKATCGFSAVMWAVGGVLLTAPLGAHAIAMDLGYAVAVVAAWVLLALLARDPHPRRDERRITGLAIIGRGMLVALLAELEMQRLGWGIPATLAVVGWIAVLVTLQVWSMLRDGPQPRLTTSAVERLRTSRSADVAQ